MPVCFYYTKHLIRKTVFLLCTSTHLRCICIDGGPFTDQDFQTHSTFIHSLNINNLTIHFSKMSNRSITTFATLPEEIILWYAFSHHSGTWTFPSRFLRLCNVYTTSPDPPIIVSTFQVAKLMQSPNQLPCRASDLWFITVSRRQVGVPTRTTGCTLPIYTARQLPWWKGGIWSKAFAAGFPSRCQPAEITLWSSSFLYPPILPNKGGALSLTPINKLHNSNDKERNSAITDNMHDAIVQMQWYGWPLKHMPSPYVLLWQILSTFHVNGCRRK